MKGNKQATRGGGCAAITKAGEACPNPPASEGEWCGLHDPAIASEARSAGGRAATARAYLSGDEAAEMIQLRDLDGTRATLGRVATAVASGRLDQKVGNTILVAAQIAIAALRAADDAEERAAKRAAELDDDELDRQVETWLARKAAERSQ